MGYYTIDKEGKVKHVKSTSKPPAKPETKGEAGPHSGAVDSSKGTTGK